MILTPISTPDNWPDLKDHHITEHVPVGVGIDLDALARHMRLNGYDQSEPIVLYHDAAYGKLSILDGRNRHRAAKGADVEPVFSLFEGTHDEAEAFVSQRKALRQHLDKNHLALAAHNLTKPIDHGGKGLTQAQAADEFDLSVSTIKRAKERAGVKVERRKRQGKPTKAVRPDEEMKDCDGTVIPERLRGVFLCVDLFDTASKRSGNLGETIQKIEASEAYAFIAKFQPARVKHRFSGGLHSASRHIAAMKPIRVCKACMGVEGSEENDLCAACEGKGFLVADEVEEA